MNINFANKSVKRWSFGVATDHGGFELKEKLALCLAEAGYEVTDFGAYRLTADDDYPDYVIPLAQALAHEASNVAWLSVGVALGPVCAIEHPQCESDSDRSKGKRGHSSYWRFAHRDWRFWLGLVLIFGAMFIYLMTEDLSVRPRPQAPTSQAAGSKDK